MATLVFLVGQSGTGKSTSIRNLDPERTVLINSDQKALPFKGFRKNYNKEKGNYLQTSDIKEVKAFLKDIHGRKNVDTVVIDTWSRIMTDSVMSPAFRNASNGMNAWSNLAFENYNLINIINEKLRDDIIVYVVCHPDTIYNDMGFAEERIAVQGQQLRKFSPESFSTVVLYTHVIKDPGKPPQYMFQTQTNGRNTCKSPMGMFDEETIPNDLVLINQKIKDFYS